jgi:hypothetical protein
MMLLRVWSRNPALPPSTTQGPALVLSSSVDELEDSEDDRLPSNFVVDDWIGCGKEWNDDIPKSVGKACNFARHIPPEFRLKLIPAKIMTVAALLSTSIENRSSVTLSSCLDQYSTDAPNTFVEASAAVDSHLPFLLAALPNLARQHLRLHI